MDKRTKTPKKRSIKKVVMGLSGGMDSSTLLGVYLEKGMEIHACHFQYGSKHNKYEESAMLNVVQYYRTKGYSIIVHPFHLNAIFKNFESHLLQSGGVIPEGHFTDPIMKQTVVPGRNTIFIAIMLGLAQTIDADIIALGVHDGDHEIYPDCRAGYMDAMFDVVGEATDYTIDVTAPFQRMNKAEILKLGYSLTYPVPYYLTRTCYKDQVKACGKCGSCIERLEAFKSINKNDPITYIL